MGPVSPRLLFKEILPLFQKGEAGRDRPLAARTHPGRGVSCCHARVPSLSFSTSLACTSMSKLSERQHRACALVGPSAIQSVLPYSGTPSLALLEQRRQPLLPRQCRSMSAHVASLAVSRAGASRQKMALGRKERIRRVVRPSVIVFTESTHAREPQWCLINQWGRTWRAPHPAADGRDQ